MKNNMKLDEYGMCCPEVEEKCVEDKSCNQWKKQWEEYLCNEEPPKDEPFEICDYDPNEIYFMQYKSKRAFYNEWWKEKLSEPPYDINKHKHGN